MALHRLRLKMMMLISWVMVVVLITPALAQSRKSLVTESKELVNCEETYGEYRFQMKELYNPK